MHACGMIVNDITMLKYTYCVVIVIFFKVYIHGCNIKLYELHTKINDRIN